MSGIPSPFTMMPGGNRPPRKVVQNIQLKHREQKLPRIIEISAIGGFVATSVLAVALIREGGALEIVGIGAIIVLTIAGAKAVIDLQLHKEDKKSAEEQMKEVAEMISKQINGQF